MNDARNSSGIGLRQNPANCLVFQSRIYSSKQGGLRFQGNGSQIIVMAAFRAQISLGFQVMKAPCRFGAFCFFRIPHFEANTELLLYQTGNKLVSNMDVKYLMRWVRPSVSVATRVATVCDSVCKEVTYKKNQVVFILFA